MKSFAVVLRDALRKKYGRIPSAAFLAIHFNRCFPEGAPVSQETTRKWMRGISMPSYPHLRALMIWLTLDARKCFDLDCI
ncbi:MAG: hypothetical protein ACK5FO_01790 [Burkholderiales bacterium]|jgi:hypothetical protein